MVDFKKSPKKVDILANKIALLFLKMQQFPITHFFPYTKLSVHHCGTYSLLLELFLSYPGRSYNIEWHETIISKKVWRDFPSKVSDVISFLMVVSLSSTKSCFTKYNKGFIVGKNNMYISR